MPGRAIGLGARKPEHNSIFIHNFAIFSHRTRTRRGGGGHRCLERRHGTGYSRQRTIRSTAAAVVGVGEAVLRATVAQSCKCMRFRCVTAVGLRLLYTSGRRGFLLENVLFINVEQYFGRRRDASELHQLQSVVGRLLQGARVIICVSVNDDDDDDDPPGPRSTGRQ